jgi:hypothetical protein
MRHSGRWLTYRSALYHFEPFGGAPGGRAQLWAVFCRGQMVGTMALREREPEPQFISRAMRWLDDAAGAPDQRAARLPGLTLLDP